MATHDPSEGTHDTDAGDESDPSGQGRNLPAPAPEESSSPEDDEPGRDFGLMVHGVEGYDGPIPHPRHLEHFESVLPGAADLGAAFLATSAVSAIAVFVKGRQARR